jgi:hypothetical protein
MWPGCCARAETEAAESNVANTAILTFIVGFLLAGMPGT